MDNGSLKIKLFGTIFIPEYLALCKMIGRGEGDQQTLNIGLQKNCINSLRKGFLLIA